MMINEKDLPIDREKKLILLGWLKRGAIDCFELINLASEANKSMTREDIEAELDRYAVLYGDEDCQRLQRLGLCKYCKMDREAI